MTVSPGSLSFGSVNTGTSSVKSVTISNTGTGTLTVNSASVTGTGFTAGGATFPLNLTSGQSANVAITFAPSTAGSYSGSVSFPSNAATQAPAVTLSGTATTIQTIVLNPSVSNMVFGSVNVGSSSSQTVKLTNAGNAAATISSINISGAGFSVTGVTAPATVAAGGNVVATVVFAPQTPGAVSGSVSFVSNASNSPASVTVSGTGALQHSADLSWTASTSANVTSYNVYRSSISGGPYSLVGSVSSTTFADNTVAAGQTYFYVVTAVDNTGAEGPFSTEVSGTIPTP
ncbi:MAG TPA: choice-of-anchor D domain-containing protein [Terriglobales bacterium]|nr:choice-of-anchor D domain-containing protein [Terriglobales bacterium]